KGTKEMKTVIVGGASISWIPIFTQDFCKCEEMRGATLVLHDINVPQMEFLKVFIEKVMEEKQHYFTVEIEPELDRALEGADIVICNVLVGGQQAWVKEIEYLRDMGIAHPKGMSVGPGGMMMGLKQIPYMLSLCEKMERICPNAWLLNYSNPMQCITLAAQRYSKLKVIGLCHGVMHSLEKYCEYLGVKRSDVTVKVGGVNHFELILEMKKDGKDMLPALAEAMDRHQNDGDPEFEDLTTREMYRIYGALPTNHDIHSIEFYPHFLKRWCDLKKYRLEQNDVNKRIEDQNARREKVQRYIDGKCPLTDVVKVRHTEMLDKIIHAIVANDPMVLVANVTNNGSISNLPPDACVGVNVVLERDGYTPCNTGAVPAGLDALQYTQCVIQNFIVNAAVTGDRHELMKAMTLDPMCYDLSYEERKKMIDDLLEISKEYLPAFFK
ncbi:hypothetical protein DWW15_19740, partial [Subdoligranulum sp. AF14-43]